MYQGVVYQEGANIPGSTPCEVIQCVGGQVQTMVVDCAEHMVPHLWVCANPVKESHQCCSSCPSGGKRKVKIN